MFLYIILVRRVFKTCCFEHISCLVKRKRKLKRTESLIIAAVAGFKTPEMNWDATALRDELAKFKQYCDLIFSGPYSKKSARPRLLWIDRHRLISKQRKERRTVYPRRGYRHRKDVKSHPITNRTATIT